MDALDDCADRAFAGLNLANSKRNLPAIILSVATIPAN